MIDINLADKEQETLLKTQLETLSDTEQQTLESGLENSQITALVDGRGLACPMPLLKTKVALRSVEPGNSVYVLATDPNSQHDLDAFCKQAGLNMILNTRSETPVSERLEKLDTIFHLIITKTHGN